MNESRWAELRRKIYVSMPFVRLILGGTSLVISDEIWQAVIGLSAVWLLTSASDVLAAKNVNVSRETSQQEESVSIAVPCAVAHGSAEPHIPVCEGWTSP
jgi:hypothetical protein